MVPLLQSRGLGSALQTLELLASGLGHLFILDKSREAEPHVRGHEASLWQGQE